MKQSATSGSFKEKDNRTPEELELIELRKQYKQLLMENDFKRSDVRPSGFILELRMLLWRSV